MHSLVVVKVFLFLWFYTPYYNIDNTTKDKYSKECLENKGKVMITSESFRFRLSISSCCSTPEALCSRNTLFPFLETTERRMKKKVPISPAKQQHPDNNLIFDIFYDLLIIKYD